jgi:hypothetical protein
MIDTGVEGLKYVRGAVTRVKETARLALAAAQHNYDGWLSKEQEAVALAADIVIEAYAVESALLRVEKMIANRAREISRRPFDAARSLSNRVSELFHNPLAIVLLVWGSLFLILGVALPYAQDASQAVDQRARRHTSVLPVSLHAGEFLHRLQILCLLFNTSPAGGTIISDAS